MLTANIHEAKTQLSRLVEAALNGEEVIISRNNKPAVRLTPILSDAPKRLGGRLRGKIKIVDPNWADSDPEITRLFYESVIFPEDDVPSR